MASALSACSRRLSGTVRARALSGAASGGQPLGFRTSNTYSSLDALALNLEGPTIECAAVKDNGLDALGFSIASPLVASSKLLGLTALGRPPPARCLQLDENDAEHTLQLPRRPSAGLLWRPSTLCTSSSMNAFLSPGHSLVHSQQTTSPSSG
ncbi:hypothetical protein BC628DRAFT_670784 [Trametes gibbosa]|nr:hypothetical protein BC628DRAFT_670784 [Trametes gibbosa]